MNTPDLRSPFVERVISLLPRGHEEAMKQAFYNVAAISLFIMIAGATMAVYFILEPFVKPLLWAILVGSVLHPIKQKSAVAVCNWLSQLREENTLLVFGFLSVPLQVINISTEWMGTTLLSNFKLLLSLTIGLHLVHIIKHHCSLSDLVSVYEYVTTLHQHFSVSNDFLFNPVTGTCFVGLIGVFITLITYQRLKCSVMLGWILMFVSVLIFLGSWSIIVIAPILVLVSVALAIHWGWLPDDDHNCNNYNTGESLVEVKRDDVALNVSTPKFQSGLTRLLRSRIVASALSSLPTPSTTEQNKTSNPSSSNRYILRALWACLAVELWRHMWLFHFVPIPLVYFMIKALGTYFNIWGFLYVYKTKLIHCVSCWFVDHKDQIFPNPLQRIHKVKRDFIKYNVKVVLMLFIYSYRLLFTWIECSLIV